MHRNSSFRGMVVLECSCVIVDVNAMLAVLLDLINAMRSIVTEGALLTETPHAPPESGPR